MQDLELLYSDSNSSCSNSLCKGCSTLGKNKPIYAYMDYEDMEECDVLFLSDSFTYRNGTTSAFSKTGIKLLRDSYPGDEFSVAASVKCPSVKDKDLTASDMKLCRVHLEATIDKVKPKLVYACGNLPMRMMIRKSGITNKRGTAFPYITPNGTECVVVPIYHPFAVVKEPKNKFLFDLDIKNAYTKYVLEEVSTGGFEYSALLDIESVRDLAEMISGDYAGDLAVDIETTGFNFITDNLQSIAFSNVDHNWAIPCDHKDSPFGFDSEDREELWVLLEKILTNPNSKKIFHNAKFDLKFLLRKGIKVVNVHDTKFMQHLYNENLPNSLKDLVKLYFPNELESL